MELKHIALANLSVSAANMAFPPAAYTERGGVPTVSRAAQVARLSAAPEPLRQAA